MSATLQGRPLVETLNGFLRRVESIKSASVDVDTSHPSKGVDDNTQPTSEGAQAAANTKLVKDTIATGGVDAAPKNTGGSDLGMIQIGTEKTPTGDQPSVEDDYKDRAKDSPTEHPATTAVGEKYSSLNIRSLKSEFAKLANTVLADIVVKNTTPATTTPETKTASTTTPVKTEVDPKAAAANGYDLATIVGESEKAAADKLALSVFESVIMEALQDAEATGRYLVERRKSASQVKKSGDDDKDDDKPSDKKPTDDKPNDTPPDGPGTLADLANAAPPPSQPAGDPAMAGGGDPSMGGPGGAPGGPGGGAGGPGGMSEDEAIQQLLMAMEELGITPEDLMAAQQHQGMPADVPSGPALGKAAKDYRRSGKYERRLPKNAAERQRINFMKDYLRELVS